MLEFYQHFAGLEIKKGAALFGQPLALFRSPRYLRMSFGRAIEKKGK
jgi:hypothetical protein